jgi:hypothetical protein
MPTTDVSFSEHTWGLQPLSMEDSRNEEFNLLTQCPQCEHKRQNRRKTQINQQSISNQSAIGPLWGMSSGD